MDPEIVSQFGMKGARPASTLANQNRLSINSSQYLHFGPGMHKSRRADEYTLHPCPGLRAIRIDRRNE